MRASFKSHETLGGISQTRTIWAEGKPAEVMATIQSVCEPNAELEEKSRLISVQSKTIDSDGVVIDKLAQVLGEAQNSAADWELKYRTLQARVYDVYYAGWWSSDRPTDAGIWERLRDAAGFQAGRATEKLGPRTQFEAADGVTDSNEPRLFRALMEFFLLTSCTISRKGDDARETEAPEARRFAKMFMAVWRQTCSPGRGNREDGYWLEQYRGAVASANQWRAPREKSLSERGAEAIAQLKERANAGVEQRPANATGSATPEFRHHPLGGDNGEIRKS